MLGAARRVLISDDERQRTAYHESGHALLGMLQPGADPVRKVSINPRGRALGVTFQSPESDRYGYAKRYLLGRVIGLLGGRAAKQLVFDDVTTGAESDLEQATALARQMVGRWGMSELIGLVSVLPRPGEEAFVFPGSAGATSPRMLEVIDREVKRITDECYQHAVRALTEHREQLDALASALARCSNTRHWTKPTPTRPPASPLSKPSAAGDRDQRRTRRRRRSANPTRRTPRSTSRSTDARRKTTINMHPAACWI